MNRRSFAKTISKALIGSALALGVVTRQNEWVFESPKTKWNTCDFTQFMVDVQPDYRLHSLGSPICPNDPLYHQSHDGIRSLTIRTKSFDIYAS